MLPNRSDLQIRVTEHCINSAYGDNSFVIIILMKEKRYYCEVHSFTELQHLCQVALCLTFVFS